MSLPQRAIGIPSNRPLERSRESIESAVRFCIKNNMRLVVSDNSGSPEKAAALKPLMQGHANLVYLETLPCGMMENWFLTFNETKSDFVLMMGDDDTVFSYGDASAFTNMPHDVVGIRPAVMGYSDTGGILRSYTSEITAEHPTQRVMDHLNTSSGANLGIFTFWRRDIFKSIMDLWFGPHPTKGTYCDWAVMNGLVSSGIILRDPSSCYFYNLQNWMGDAQAVQDMVEKAYVKTGLPAAASVYSRLFNAADSFIFVSRKDNPIPAQERFLTAIFCLDMYLKNYVASLPLASTHPRAKDIAALSQKLVNNDSIPDIFAILFDILEAIESGLGTRYKEFHKSATGKNWGVFD